MKANTTLVTRLTALALDGSEPRIKSFLPLLTFASSLVCILAIGGCTKDAAPGTSKTTSATMTNAGAGGTTPSGAQPTDLKGKGVEGFTIAPPAGATVEARKSGSRVIAIGYSLDVSAESGGSAAKRADGVKAMKELLSMSGDVARFTLESADGFIYESKSKKQFAVFRSVEAGGAAFSCVSGNKLAETAEKAAEAYAVCATLKKK